MMNGSGIAGSEADVAAGLEPLAWRFVEEAEAALRAVTLQGLGEEGLSRVVAGAGRVRALADALTLRAVGGLERLRVGSAREPLVEGAKLSGRAAKRLEEAARQVEEMPTVGRRLDAGDLTLENVFALGAAARQCGASAVDGSAELLEHAASRDSGTFGRIAREFSRSHDPTRGQSLLDHQRNARRGHLFFAPDGMGVIKGEMDPVSFGLLEQSVAERRDHLWRKDGGRDGTPEAERNNAQRTMDAIFELCTGRDALTHEQLPANDGPRRLRRLPPGSIIAVTAGVIDGTDPSGSCEMIGVGPVPPTVLDSISPDARIVGAIFGGNGQPLWLSRMERLANTAQHVAVALRDRGCVLCRAPMHCCEVHHIDEFCADEGPTDIENLAALCSNCHRWLHRTNGLYVAPMLAEPSPGPHVPAREAQPPATTALPVSVQGRTASQAASVVAVAGLALAGPGVVRPSAWPGKILVAVGWCGEIRGVVVPVAVGWCGEIRGVVVPVVVGWCGEIRGVADRVAVGPAEVEEIRACAIRLAVMLHEPDAGCSDRLGSMSGQSDVGEGSPISTAATTTVGHTGQSHRHVRRATASAAWRAWRAPCPHNSS